jgi:DNA repair protein RadD
MKEDRDEVIAAFKAGKYQALVNSDVLTTGFDFPAIDLIIMLRPTRSPGLWVQMLGRGTRPWEGKVNCLVLDFAGNTLRLGPINDPVIPGRRKKGGGEAPVRICPECSTMHHCGYDTCPECGYEYPPPPPNIEAEASTAELVARPNEPQLVPFAVDTVVYMAHHSTTSGSWSLKVTYHCGLRQFSEWVPIESQRMIGIAKKWWERRCGEPFPASAHEAAELAEFIVSPNNILVLMSGRYPEIKDYYFANENHLVDSVPF